MSFPGKENTLCLTQLCLAERVFILLSSLSSQQESTLEDNIEASMMTSLHPDLSSAGTWWHRMSGCVRNSVKKAECLPLASLWFALQVAEKWQEWKRAFEYYAKGKGIDNACKKTSQLLHFAGMEVHDNFEDLQDPGPIPETGDNAFKIPIPQLHSYFHVEGNIPYERHIFRKLAPKEEETTDPFIIWFN